jgi:hypothetical protein
MGTQKLQGARFTRPLTAAFATAALLIASISVVGCNGGFAGSSATPQTVVVTVTGTSGSIHHSTTVTIHLQ